MEGSRMVSKWFLYGCPMCSAVAGFLWFSNVLSLGFLSVFLCSACCLQMYPYCFPRSSCYVSCFPMIAFGSLKDLYTLWFVTSNRLQSLHFLTPALRAVPAEPCLQPVELCQ